MSKVVIVSAARTPIGSMNGCLSLLSAHELGAVVIGEVLRLSGIKPEEVSEVILGQVLTAGQGQNPARQAAILGGLSVEVPAWSVNQLCASGLRAVVLGCQAIQTGDSKIVIAGGQESMSKAPHVLHMRNGVKFGDVKLNDTMLSDGLTDAMNNIHMGITAENVASQWNILREDQDKFAFNSQSKCAVAQKDKHFDAEIIPITVKSRTGCTTISKDEFPRNDTSYEGLAKLKPIFITDGSGTVTAGNSSGINDGAAAVLLMSAEEAKNKNLTPLAEIIGWHQVGVDPKIMGVGPIGAIDGLLKKINWSVNDVDLFELNEAFAAQSLAVLKQLSIDAKKVNITGGAIALGHPIGASGTRILVTLIHNMRRLGVSKGVAALCVGGGMGLALAVQTCNL